MRRSFTVLISLLSISSSASTPVPKSVGFILAEYATMGCEGVTEASKNVFVILHEEPNNKLYRAEFRIGSRTIKRVLDLSSPVWPHRIQHTNRLDQSISLQLGEKPWTTEAFGAYRTKFDRYEAWLIGRFSAFQLKCYRRTPKAV